MFIRTFQKATYASPCRAFPTTTVPGVHHTAANGRHRPTSLQCSRKSVLRIQKNVNSPRCCTVLRRTPSNCRRTPVTNVDRSSAWWRPATQEGRSTARRHHALARRGLPRPTAAAGGATWAAGEAEQRRVWRAGMDAASVGSSAAQWQARSGGDVAAEVPVLTADLRLRPKSTSHHPVISNNSLCKYCNRHSGADWFFKPALVK